MKKAVSILVADDNTSVRHLAQIALQRAGMEVTVAADGLEANRFIRTRSFDVLVTDLDMPGRCGLELVADMHRLQPKAQVVVMSGDWFVALTDVRKMASNLGVRTFLTKPFPLQELRNAVYQSLTLSAEPGLEPSSQLA